MTISKGLVLRGPFFEDIALNSIAQLTISNTLQTVESLRNTTEKLLCEIAVMVGIGNAATALNTRQIYADCIIHNYGTSPAELASVRRITLRIPSCIVENIENYLRWKYNADGCEVVHCGELQCTFCNNYLECVKKGIEVSICS